MCLDSEAKTIVARLYVDGNDLSTLPPWIAKEDAEKYIEHLQACHEDMYRVMCQDIVSRREIK